MAPHWFTWLAFLGVLVAPELLAAQVNTGVVPKEIAAVNQISRNYGGELPKTAEFIDDRGHRVRLGDLLSDRPVVISLNYSNCPMLCQVMLREFVATFSSKQLVPGVDFDLISVSLDPTETSDRARETKNKYVELSGRPDSVDGWHFLTGKKVDIDRVARSIGVNYLYLPDRKEYSHPSVFVVCTPDGKISQYLEGVGLDPNTLRLSLVEASEGKLGNVRDWFVLACFVYDPNSNSYTFAAVRLMRWGAGLTVAVLLIGSLPFWLRRSTNGNVASLESKDVSTVAVEKERG